MRRRANVTEAANQDCTNLLKKVAMDEAMKLWKAWQTAMKQSDKGT